MIKAIVIAETITPRIIWRINVNQFDLSAKLGFQGVQC